MARPLREGSLAEPPAPLPVPPACGGGALPAPPACVGGALPAPPACVGGVPPALPAPPPRRHPRLSCACPGGPPPAFLLYRYGTRGPHAAAAAHGMFQPTEDGDHEGQSGGSRGGGAVANGHLPGEATGPEQELGARLRRLGDAFQQTYEQQREQRGGVFWGHLYRLVSQWLGAGYNLQAAALPAREAN